MNRTEYLFGTAVSIIGTAFTYAIGGFDKLLIALVIFMIIDYITGVIAAWCFGMLNSKTGFRGIVKKIVILAIVAMAHQIDLIAAQELVRTMVTWFFLGNEGLSIML